MELVVAQPVVGEAIDGWHVNRPAERARHAEAHVVDEDDEDVRRSLGRLHLETGWRCGLPGVEFGDRRIRRFLDRQHRAVDDRRPAAGVGGSAVEARAGRRVGPGRLSAPPAPAAGPAARGAASAIAAGAGRAALVAAVGARPRGAFGPRSPIAGSTGSPSGSSRPPDLIASRFARRRRSVPRAPAPSTAPGPSAPASAAGRRSSCRCRTSASCRRRSCRRCRRGRRTRRRCPCAPQCSRPGRECCARRPCRRRCPA